MFENIKTDIIYFKSNTDFELEFNLCGSCKMRLLTTKTSDKKTFVHSLARAVSRSQIVIIIGSIFGEEGTINLTANAIGSSLSTVNNSDYGIESDQDIEIIKGSVPLVTPEGYFGGCIIESGPQTIILLTENKNIRKTIMESLIHPYIQDLCSAELTEETVEEVEETTATEEVEETLLTEEETLEETEEDLEENSAEGASEDTEEAVTQEKIVEEETETAKEVIDEETEEEVIEDTADTLEQEKKQEDIDDGDFFFFSGVDSESNIEPEPFSPVPTNYTSYSTRKAGIFGIFGEKESEEVFTFDDEKEEEPVVIEDDKDDDFEPYNDVRPKFPKKKSGLKISMIVFMVIVLLAIAVLCYSLFYVPAQSGTTAADNIQEIINTLLG